MKIWNSKKLGITLGTDTSSKLNGAVGRKITKKLVNLGKQHIVNKNVIIAIFFCKKTCVLFYFWVK